MPIKGNRCLFLAGCAALGLVVSACGSSSGSGGSSSSSGSCPVKIAVIGPLTGSSAAYGHIEQIGYELAAKALNSSTKVLGCPVSLTYIDDASDPSTIPGLITKAASDGYSYVTQFGPGTDVALQFFNTQKLLSIGTDGEEAYNNPSKYPLWFDMNSSIDQPIIRLADAMAAAGYRRIAIVQANITNVGGNDSNDVTTALQGTNSHVVTTQSVPLTLSDGTATALKVKQANPDSVIVDLYGPALGVVLKAFDAAGVTVPRFGGWYAAAGNPALAAAPSDVKNMVISTYKASISGAIPGMDNFAKQVAALAPNHQVTVPIIAASGGYDALIAWAAAVNATKTFKSPALAKWLAANGQTQIPGLISFDPKVLGYSASNHIAIGGYGLAKAPSLDSDGQFEPATVPSIK